MDLYLNLTLYPLHWCGTTKVTAGLWFDSTATKVTVEFVVPYQCIENSEGHNIEFPEVSNI